VKEDMMDVNMPQSFKTIEIRDINEEIIDKVLLLYLINKVNERGELRGITKLMKLIFFAEKEMVEDKVKGFNYSFFKWHLGPFTPEVYWDLDYLMENELATEHEFIELTDHGKGLLKGIKPFLEENCDIMRYIEKVAETYSNVWVSELMDLAYETKVEIIPSKTKAKIKDVPKGNYLLTKLSEIEANRVFEIDEEWLETFDTLLDREEYNSLMEAMESARTTESKKVEIYEL